MRRQECQPKLCSDDLRVKFRGGRKLLDGNEIVVLERRGPAMRPDEGSKELLIDFTTPCFRNRNCAFRWIPRNSDLCDWETSFFILCCYIGLLNDQNDFTFAQSSVGQASKQVGVVDF